MKQNTIDDYITDFVYHFIEKVFLTCSLYNLQIMNKHQLLIQQHTERSSSVNRLYAIHLFIIV